MRSSSSSEWLRSILPGFPPTSSVSKCHLPLRRRSTHTQLQTSAVSCCLLPSPTVSRCLPLPTTRLSLLPDHNPQIPADDARADDGDSGDLSGGGEQGPRRDRGRWIWERHPGPAPRLHGRRTSQSDRHKGVLWCVGARGCAWVRAVRAWVCTWERAGVACFANLEFHLTNWDKVLTFEFSNVGSAHLTKDTGSTFPFPPPTEFTPNVLRMMVRECRVVDR